MKVCTSQEFKNTVSNKLNSRANLLWITVSYKFTEKVYDLFRLFLKFIFSTESLNHIT